MRKSAVLAVLAVFCLGASALGAIQPGHDVVVDYWSARPSGQSQGPFYLRVYDDSSLTGTGSGTTLVTHMLNFCVEQNETFNPGTRYNIASISVGTVQTGRNLSGYTAWIYDGFLEKAQMYGWTNTHGPLTPTADPVPTGAGTWGTAMNAYQDAVWAGMVKSDWSDPVGGTFSEKPMNVNYNNNTLFNNMGISLEHFFASGWGGTSYSWAYVTTSMTNAEKLAMLQDLQDYQILNVAINNQDFVFIQGGGGGIVPEPASLLIWSLLGVAGVSVWSRRRTSPRWSPASREAISSLIERGRKA